ncbi:hypothetical protein FHU33_1977 [Blastococcus colisei]|uniref:Uncharacterized protein n=1 Tax=Blastococcus colisei TaxID=1564162 RepID=A0A543PET3_9ACTN|nr:hypothetical protein [Blastococcus colisei]TQN42573.1 hypothetical protein FHU33_1977 [Blastococcus colisei]
MNRGEHLAAVAGLGAGAAVIGVAGLLLHRTLAVAQEIGRYADDIAAAASALRGNTELAGHLTTLGAGAARLRAAADGSAAEGARR